MSLHQKVLAGLSALALSACAAPMQFQAALNGASESPRTNSAGTGTLTATLYPDTHAFSYTLNYSGLSGPATAAHVHGPAAPGANAGVMVPFPSPAAGATGMITLTEAQQATIVGGQAYTNVHTAANPGGEIRGQIARVQ